MEPQGDTFDFTGNIFNSNFGGGVDAIYDNQQRNSWLEQIAFLATSICDYARVIGSSVLDGATLAYGLLSSILQLSFLGYGVLVYIMNEASIKLAVLLRTVARNASVGAELLESMHLRSSGRFATQQPHQQTPVEQPQSVRSPAKSTNQITQVLSPSIVQTVVPAEEITSDDEDDSMEETAYEVRYRGLHRALGGVVESVGHQVIVHTTSRKVKKRQRGNERIRALREERRRKGLPVCS